MAVELGMIDGFLWCLIGIMTALFVFWVWAVAVTADDRELDKADQKLEGNGETDHD